MNLKLKLALTFARPQGYQEELAPKSIVWLGAIGLKLHKHAYFDSILSIISDNLQTLHNIYMFVPRSLALVNILTVVTR